MAVGSSLACGFVELAAKFHSSVSIDFLAFLEQALVLQDFFVGEAALVFVDLGEHWFLVFLPFLSLLLFLEFLCLLVL